MTGHSTRKLLAIARIRVRDSEANRHLIGRRKLVMTDAIKVGTAAMILKRRHDPAPFERRREVPLPSALPPGH